MLLQDAPVVLARVLVDLRVRGVGDIAIVSAQRIMSLFGSLSTLAALAML